MVIVAGTMDVDADDRERFLRQRAEQVRRSRLEHGCLDYTFSIDVEQAGRVRLFERWTDRDALDAHVAALQARAADTPAVTEHGEPVAVLAATSRSTRSPMAIPSPERSGRHDPSTSRGATP